MRGIHPIAKLFWRSNCSAECVYLKLPVHVNLLEASIHKDVKFAFPPADNRVSTNSRTSFSSSASMRGRPGEQRLLDGLVPAQYAVLTLHHPANMDSPDRMALILGAVNAITDRIPVVFPVHPRTAPKLNEIELHPSIRTVEPMSYSAFLCLIARSRMVLTDSGGIHDRDRVGREQEMRNGVGAEPVDLFWNGHVARAQSRFDVSDTDAEFFGREGTRECRIHVSDDDHPIRTMFQADRLEAIIIRAVCSACEPEPTSRLMSGSGMPRSRKNSSDMFRLYCWPVWTRSRLAGECPFRRSENARWIGAIFMKLCRAPVTNKYFVEDIRRGRELAGGTSASSCDSAAGLGFYHALQEMSARTVVEDDFF